MLVQNGTYPAVAREATVYENEKGSLVVAFNFQLTLAGEPKFIKGFAQLAKADGTINTKSIESLKKTFAWDGHDPFWFADTDLAHIPVELVVENDTADDGRTFSRVKWINRPGSSALPEPADRNAILSRYGSRFRALSGGTPVKPALKSGPQIPTTPVLPGLPSAPCPTGPAPAVSSMQKCWEFFCAHLPGLDQAELEQRWFALLSSLYPGKESSSLSPQDWGKVAARLADDLPD